MVDRYGDYSSLVSAERAFTKNELVNTLEVDSLSLMPLMNLADLLPI